jgi:hypothetical protein
VSCRNEASSSLGGGGSRLCPLTGLPPSPVASWFAGHVVVRNAASRLHFGGGLDALRFGGPSEGFIGAPWGCTTGGVPHD